MLECWPEIWIAGREADVCAIFVVTISYIFMLDTMDNPGLYGSELISREIYWNI